MEAIFEHGGMRLDQFRTLGEVESGYTYFREGDVVLAKITPCFENVKGSIAEGLENGIGFGTTELHVLRPLERVECRFLFYLTISHAFRNNGASWMYGAGGQKRVPDDFIRDFRHQIPPIDVQQHLAEYLDCSIARIDSLIKKKQQQIKLLQEKRAALISHAVTKGLNPDARMKDSEIEWIGTIPETWEIKRLRFLGNCENGISIGGEFFGTGDPFVSYGDVYRNRELPAKIDGLVQSSASDKARYSVEKGDVFFTRTSETVEEIGISSVCLNSIADAVFAGFLIRFRPRGEKLDKVYSKYYFQNNLLRAFFVKEMNIVTRASLSQDLLKQMPVLIPPIEEQVRIASLLERENFRTEKLIGLVEQSIQTLRAYRSAVISTAVTGFLGLHGN